MVYEPLYHDLQKRHFGGVKTIIPLALVGYEMITANLVVCAYAPRWLSIISYPTHAHGIIMLNISQFSNLCALC